MDSKARATPKRGQRRGGDGATAPQPWDGEEDVRKTLKSVFSGPGSVVELRALGVQDGGLSRPCVVSGYFNDPEALLAEARRLDGRASGLYVTANVVNPALIARADNRTLRSPRATTSDKDIRQLRLFIVDADPLRPSGISATKAEQDAAFKVLREVGSFLEGLGFPAPLKAGSGNGGHLVYGLDIPVSDGGLVKQALEALAFLFNTDGVTIDTSVHNPGQILKLYGTLSRKGDDTPDRPHRRSRIFSKPEALEPVRRDLLEQLAAMAPKTEPARVAQQRSEETLDIPALLGRRGLEVLRQGPWQGGQRWVLAVCPFEPSHADGAAYVVQFPSGAIAAGCHHNGCSVKGWRELRDLLEPDRQNCQNPSRGSSVSFGSGPPGGSTDFGHPEALPPGLPPVREFTLDLLPSGIRGWVADICDRVQCPLAYVAVAAMVGLATVLGRRVGIRPKRQDDWLVVANLWAMLVGRPGVLKTPALQEALRPLYRLELAAKDAYAAELREYGAQDLVRRARRRSLERAIEAAVRNGEDAESLARQAVEDESPAPVRERFIVNDSTVEKQGELLRDSPNGILITRDELIGFLRTLDKEGHEGARSFYLEAWNGTGRFTYDRIGRGTVEIEAAIVSLVGSIQPGPLMSYVSAAQRSESGDDGLVQRFQLAVWPDIDKTWVNIDRWPDSAARAQAFETYERLARITAEEVGAMREDGDQIPYLRFAPAAQERFDEWRTQLERRVRGDVEAPVMESHLAKYRSLIPSLALLIHLADGGLGQVSLHALDRAIVWGEVLESHARRIYSASIDVEGTAGRALAQKLLRKQLPDGFTLRDVYRRGWTSLKTREEAQAGVNLLVELDWLREEERRPAGAGHPGGRPSNSYQINPRIWELPSGGTDKTDETPSPDTQPPPDGADRTDKTTPAERHAQGAGSGEPPTPPDADGLDELGSLLDDIAADPDELTDEKQGAV